MVSVTTLATTATTKIHMVNILDTDMMATKFNTAFTNSHISHMDMMAIVFMDMISTMPLMESTTDMDSDIMMNSMTLPTLVLLIQNITRDL
jgi:hypothetical protein